MLIKTVTLFYSKKLANAKKYIYIHTKYMHKEKNKVDINQLENAHYKIKLTHMIA